MNLTPEPLDAQAEEDPRLVRAAQEYLAALESGRRPSRTEFVARFPGLGAQLAPYLDALDMVHGAVSLAPRSPAKAAAPDLLAAEALGDFHIVREIGRGGMGVVYEAIQLSLGRRVALKVLPFAAGLDARQLQRFKNEAQAAAQLHHTNIVPVYAVGCERGTHYYAMQLIEGQNLADLIQQLRSVRKGPARNGAPAGATASRLHPDRTRSAGAGVNSALPPTGPEITTAPVPQPPPAPAPAPTHTPAAELTTHLTARSERFYRMAVRLALQAAEALEHAHQFDVIHRDVKPANLIVDERGNLWVTDFGLAQFQTTQGLTRSGDLLGTLRYMSPEQAGGNHALLDARTDVYSLGATLYELLTLEPLFDGPDTQRLLKQILHDEPRPPRSLDRSLPQELETIVLKAVAKNPADRYATARELADDLRRFLDNRPILARPPSLAQRARKWARRHPSVVAAVIVVCVLTTAGSLVSAWMIHQEQEKTLARAKQAEEGLKLARKSADDMIQISQQELAGRPGTEAVRKRLLEKALEYYQGLIEQSADDPNAQKELEDTRKRVQSVLADLAVLQGGDPLNLLHRLDVRDDQSLGLTEERRAKLGDLLQRVGREREDGRPQFSRLSAEQRELRIRDDIQAHEAALRGILDPPQRKRIDQIGLQLKGLFAFHDDKVVEALNLTTAQKQRLQEIEAEGFRPMLLEARKGPGGPDGGPEPGRGSDPEKGPEPRKRFELGFQPLIEKFVNEVLTAEQRQKWKDLTGEPFKGQLGPVFFPPPESRPGGQPPDRPWNPPPPPGPPALPPHE